MNRNATDQNKVRGDTTLTNGSLKQRFDVIVVGGGHAGAEAAAATARGGLSTLLLTLNLDTIGQMSCNPAIGGIAKGHIVREVDALGGIMGRIIDRTGIHFKMLNRSRGPAVWAPRAQAEKREYQNQVKWTLEATPNLRLFQDSCESLLLEGSRIVGIQTGRGHEIYSENVILTTGTFLNGLIHIGGYQEKSGRFGEGTVQGLSVQLKEIGFRVGRLKTGTPPRILKSSVDLDSLEIQAPDENPQPFSYQTERIGNEQVNCHITHTNSRTHEIIQANLHRSPLYGGIIQGTGPRYCPSIEDKIVRFAGRERHQIFLEPEGVQTGELYLNGISTSLPEDVQWELVRSCRGMEEARIIRPGYAVEYDHVDPTELGADLQTKRIRGLYLAGQINGTTGYEEAAGQGLLAGMNVLLRVQNEEPLILSRGEAYIGVLIDDLVYKGVEDPYRMFTSRAEHRLVLRQDNADRRLMKYGRRLGLIAEDIFQTMEEKYARVEGVRRMMMTSGLKPTAELDLILQRKRIEIGKAGFGKTLADFLKRPEIELEDCPGISEMIRDLNEEQRRVLEMEIKYEGYVKREEERIRKREKNRELAIPSDFNYDLVAGIKAEAREKLKKFQPRDLDAASRISGIDPPDIDLIYLQLKIQAAAV